MRLLIPASRALCSSTACLTVPYDPTQCPMLQHSALCCNTVPFDPALHARLHSPLCPNVPTVPNTLSSGCHTLLLKRTCYLCSYNVLRLCAKVMLKGRAAAEGSREEENTNSACGAFFGGGSGDLGNVL